MLNLIEADITRQSADAIVNAANSRLEHGGGVAAAIAAAAGPELEEDSRRAPFVKPGGAWATRAGKLDAACVIHAVGPIWSGGDAGEAETLASAYKSAVALAASLGCRSIALPALSTGIFGFPLELAAPVAVSSVREAMLENPTVSRATFCLLGAETMEAFSAAAG